MSGFAITPHRVLALSLALAMGFSTLVLGGCAVQTAGGDPASTQPEQGMEPGEGAATAEAPTSPKANVAVPSAAAKPATETAGGKRPVSNTLILHRSVQDNTEPQPWNH